MLEIKRNGTYLEARANDVWNHFAARGGRGMKSAVFSAGTFALNRSAAAADEHRVPVGRRERVTSLGYSLRWSDHRGWRRPWIW